KFYTADDSDTPIATYTTNTINSILGSSAPNPYPGTSVVTALDGSAYRKGYYFGRPAAHTSLTPTANTAGNTESHAFLSLYTSGSIAFKKLEFTGNGFEFDNIAVSSTATTPPGSSVFIESVYGKSVTFLPNGGAGTMPSQTSNTSTTLVANSFTREGYTFSGWHTTESGTGGTPFGNQAAYNFSADLTLYAQWTPNTLTITHNTQGGTSIADATTTTGATIQSSPETPTRDGYTFNGWFIASSGGTPITFPYAHGQTTNFTLYAQWTPNTLTVTHNTQGGTSIADATTTTGATIQSSPGTPTRDGYTFNGWFIASSGGTPITFPYAHGQTTNFTLYAQWTPNTPVSPEPSSSTAVPTPTPELDTPTDADTGKTVTVIARGFEPGETVTLTIGSKTLSSVADSNGIVIFNFELPNSTAGRTRVVARGQSSGNRATSEIRINSLTSLPKTGASMSSIVISSSILMTAGLIAVQSQHLTRRRRKRVG
ncbi:MAG: hypothetical protein RIR69_229, partial [Actinomycetota bacterium]